MLRIAAQIAFVAFVAWLLWYLYTNLLINMRGRGIRTDFDFLEQSAGFTLLTTLVGEDFSSRQPIWQAIMAGLGNTIVVSALGVVLATVLGVVVGVARLSTNWLVRTSAAAFVEAFRNIPLLILLVFLYIAVLQQLPPASRAIAFPGIVLSNRGLWVPWFDADERFGAYLLVLLGAFVVAIVVGIWRTRRFDATGEPHHRIAWGAAILAVGAVIGWLALRGPVVLSIPVRDGRAVQGGYTMSPEYGALLFGLVIYTAAFIAEIIRGSILAVPKGQTEAANAVGLTGFQRLRYVILPQSMRIAVPPAGNEFLNLTKNSALGIVIAFPELLRVIRIAIGNGHPAPQLIGIMLLIYLSLSLTLSGITNLINRRLAIRGA